MARGSRQFHEGGVYHIIQRGNNKAYIFDQQTDKAAFLEMSGKIMETNPYYMLAYVLMDNHYHLLVEMRTDSIDIIMHKLNMGYSKYFNKKYGRVGTIFGGRYKSIPVTDQAQFCKVIQYILFNPVRAKMVQFADQYRWSSHFEMGLKRPPLLSRDRVLWRLDHNKENAMQKYEELIHGKTKMMLHQSHKVYSENIQSSSVEIFFKHWSEDSVVCKAIRSKDRSKQVVSQRNAFVKEALQHGFGVSEIAEFLNYSERSIRAIRARIDW